jgi:cyclase
VPDDYEPYLTELAPGVHAYVQPDGGWCLSNAGFVSDGHSTLLVDTAATELRTRRLRDALLATGAPMPSYVVNTHHHGDHTYGNSLFASPGAELVAHAACEKAQLTAGHELHVIWPAVDYGHVPVTPPTLTYEDRMTLEVAGTEVRLIHPGPAHSIGDTIVWLPERRIVFTGDLIFNGGTPFVSVGSLSGSLLALDVLRGLDAEIVVPGHGAVCDPEVFDTVEGYLRWVAGLAAEGHAAGRTPMETAQAADPGEAGFGGLRESERLVANLHRAYAELDGLPPGTPLDLAVVYGDLVRLNGGRYPECFA